MVFSQTVSLDQILAQLIGYLTYCALLAGAVQVTVNQLKPIFIEPLKAKLDDAQYLATIYIVRTLFTILGYFTLWGGVEATRAVLPEMARSLPDVGIAGVTIACIVLGQEVLHAWVSRLYQIEDATKLLNVDPLIQPTTDSSKDGQTSNETTATVETTKTVTVSTDPVVAQSNKDFYVSVPGSDKAV